VTVATGDVVVRHCAVHVHRRGGWSWGPEPDQLARRVVAALPDLLARRFAEQLAGEVDVEITEPVRIVVSVPLAVLASGLGPDQLPVDILVDPAPPAEPSIVDGPGTPPSQRWSPRGAPKTSATAFPLGDPAELDRLLRTLPPEVLRRYRAAGGLPTGADGGDGDAPTAAGPAGPVAADPDRPAVVADLGPAGGRARLDGSVEVGSALPFLVVGALARIGLLDAVGPVLAGAGLAGEDAPLFAAALAYKVLASPERGWRRTAGDRVAAAALAGLADEVPEEDLTALAHRITPALPVLDGLIAMTLCDGHEPDSPLLLAAAHERQGGGLLLVEPDGLFPIAWADEVGALLPCWERCGRPPVLVPSPPGPPAPASVAGSPGPPARAHNAGLLRVAGPVPGVGPPAPVLAPVGTRHIREWAGAGAVLVSDAGPTRGEWGWRRLPSPRRWWAIGALPRPLTGVDLAGLAGDLDELVGLMAQRRAVPLAGEPAVERTLTMAATVALGTISWLLWRHREPPVPQLALTRLADLSAVVSYDADVVRVRLPLGRRHSDLLEHGLLTDIPQVVWLGGRTVSFSGG
jgi:hypothetical protein